MSRPAGNSGRASGSGSPLARLPQLVTVLAAAALAAQLATVLWQFIPGARRAHAPAQVAAFQPPADLSELTAAHLFGSAAGDPVTGGEAPQSNVALLLAGTLAVRDPKAGLAIIGEPSQAGHVYAVGATLPGGVRLHEVYTNHVLIERAGLIETLLLPHAVGGGGNARRPPVARTEPPLAETVQKLIAGGPEVVGDVLRPMPSYANGKLMGFRVYAGRDRRKFAKLGLQPGDVVTQVNGVPLGDAQHGLDALRSLGAAGTATVTVERAGSTQQVTIDSSQLTGISDGTAPMRGAPVPPPGQTAVPAQLPTVPPATESPESPD